MGDVHSILKTYFCKLWALFASQATAHNPVIGMKATAIIQDLSASIHELPVNGNKVMQQGGPIS